MKNIASYIKSLNKNLLFEFACRVDAVEYETFSELYDNGLSGVFLGIESSVQKILNSFHKKTLVEQNIEALKILSDIGIGCDIGFIMFNNTITMPEVLENFYFLKNIYENYNVYVHPITLLREEKDYPKDLGLSFLVNDSTAVNYEDKRVQSFKNYLDELWQHDYRETFLQLEKSSILDNSQHLIEKSRELTKFMLDVGINEIRQILKTKSYA